MNYDTHACAEVCEKSPEFAQVGVTAAVCNSLKNNTGLNPNLPVLSDNETDLAQALDCLVGRLDDEVDCYENCDWRKFMHDMIPRFYNMMKAMLCSDAGAWHSGGEECDCDAIDSRLDTLEAQAGSGELDTTAQDFVGAINEIVGSDIGASETEIELTIPATNTNIAAATSATIRLYKIGKLVYCAYIGVISPTAANTLTSIGAAGTIPAAFRPAHIAFEAVIGLASHDPSAQARFEYGVNGEITAEFSSTGNKEYHHNTIWLTN